MTRKANWEFYEPLSPENHEALTPLVALINTLQEHSRYWEIGKLLHDLEVELKRQRRAKQSQSNRGGHPYSPLPRRERTKVRVNI